MCVVLRTRAVLMAAADWWTALCRSAYLQPADVFAVIVSAFLFPMMLSGRQKNICRTLTDPAGLEFRGVTVVSGDC